MDDSHNFTFDEIVVGHSETLTRQLSVTEIEALALAAGAIDPAHIEGAPTKDGPTAPGAVLTSRADPVRTRLVSTAVMMLVAHSRRLAARPVV
jgi:hypothetical protein